MKDYLITKSELASILGVSTTAIDSWRTTRDFNSCYVDSKINLILAFKWLYDWKNELADSSSTDASEQKKFWDAQRSKVNYLMMVESLVPKLEYIQSEKERFHLLKAGVMSLPDQLAPELNLNPDQVDLVEQKCRAVIHGLKDTYGKRKADWEEVINSKIEVVEYDNHD